MLEKVLVYLRLLGYDIKTENSSFHIEKQQESIASLSFDNSEFVIKSESPE